MGDIAGAGLREQKKQLTRAAVETAGLALARRHGFDALTVEAIAAEAEVSQSTVFRYFESKESIILQRYIERLGLVADALQASDPGLPLGRASRSALLQLADVLTEDRQAVLEMMAVARRSEQLLSWGRARQYAVIVRIAGWLAGCQEFGADDVRPWLFAHNLIAVAGYSLICWTNMGATGSLHQIIEEALSYSEQGMGLGTAPPSA